MRCYSKLETPKLAESLSPEPQTQTCRGHAGAPALHSSEQRRSWREALALHASGGLPMLPAIIVMVVAVVIAIY